MQLARLGEVARRGGRHGQGFDTVEGGLGDEGALGEFDGSARVAQRGFRGRRQDAGQGMLERTFFGQVDQGLLQALAGVAGAAEQQ